MCNDLYLYLADGKIKRLSDYGYCISERVKFPVATMDVEEIHIPGRDGSLTIENGYQDIEIEIEINAMADNARSLELMTTSLIQDLQNTEKISFEVKKDKFNIVKHVDISVIDSQIDEHKAMGIKFKCDPYYYYFSGVNPIYNPRKIKVQSECKPKITLTLINYQQEMKVEINSQVYRLNGSKIPGNANGVVLDPNLNYVYARSTGAVIDTPPFDLTLSPGFNDISVTNINGFYIETNDKSLY